MAPRSPRRPPADPAPRAALGAAAFAPVAVVGLGAIGGSMARALAAQGVAVWGWADADADRRLASEAGIRVRDHEADIPALLRGVATVVLAVPLRALAAVARQIVPLARPDAVLLHVAGLQRREALALDAELFERVVGAHPLAGSHQTGFAASRADMFQGATVSVEERADARTRERIDALWRAAGARAVVYRAAAEHDRLMAWVSHLPQLAASALAATLAGAGVDPGAAGPGARDTTRIAASPLESWSDILMAAPPETIDALARLRETVDRLAAALQRRDRRALADIWHPARAWRSALVRQL